MVKLAVSDAPQNHRASTSRLSAIRAAGGWNCRDALVSFPSRELELGISLGIRAALTRFLGHEVVDAVLRLGPHPCELGSFAQDMVPQGPVVLERTFGSCGSGMRSFLFPNQPVALWHRCCIRFERKVGEFSFRRLGKPGLRSFCLRAWIA